MSCHLLHSEDLLVVVQVLPAVVMHAAPHLATAATIVSHATTTQALALALATEIRHAMLLSLS